MNSFSVSYVTTLPKVGNAPIIQIDGDIDETYNIFLYNDNKLVKTLTCKTNERVESNLHQWFTNWGIIIKNTLGKIVYFDKFDIGGKVVFIKFDSYALGDTIAWIPYVEEFRKKHGCIVICSTFHNHILENAYKNILFVKPNTIISNVYCQYYIGANEEGGSYCRVNPKKVPLQMIACDILGLNYEEIRPDLSIGVKKSDLNKNKYVTLSEFGSSSNKEWKCIGGWQELVNYLNKKGYDVVVISREPTSLKNVINLTGEIDLQYRIRDILHAEFHIGVSSGLSWLAWSLGKNVIMISDVTPIWHEFTSNNLRFCASNLLSVDYENKGVTDYNDILSKLDEMGI